MATDQSVRTLMNNAGYDNSKIGYNNNSGYVTYDNQPFMKPKMVVNGTAYTDPSTFTTAHSSFKQANPSYFSTPNTSTTPAASSATGTAENPASGSSLPDYNPMINDLYSKINNSQPYDVYSDPMYKAALANNQYLAQQQNRQTQEAYGASGFGRSTNLGDRLMQDETNANNYMNTQVIPGIVSEHYQQQQNDIANRQNLINTLMNQANQQWQERNTYGNEMGVMPNGQQTLAYKEYQQTQNPNSYANSLQAANVFGTVSPEQAKILGIPAGTPTRALQQLENQLAYQNAELGLRQQSNNIANGRLSAYLDSANARNGYYGARTQEALANLKKLQNSSTSSKKTPTSYKTDPNFAQDYQQITKDPVASYQQLQSNPQAFINEYGLDGYDALVKLAQGLQPTSTTP